MASLFLAGLLISAFFIGGLPTLVAVEDGETGTARVDGPAIWKNATILEQIGASHPAYRSAGSAGANASADWISSRFEELGLETWTEEFQFYGWDLATRPSMEVTYQDGSTVRRMNLSSFQSEQFSFATPSDGISKEVVLLPLPSSNSFSSFTELAFDIGDWQDIDIYDRIVLIGREVRWNQAWEEGLADKLQGRPAVLVFYYSQTWTSSWEVMYHASCGGMPLSNQGSYFHQKRVPCGSLDIQDSEWLLDRIVDGNVTAKVAIDAKEGIWTQKNVVARLPGATNNSSQILLTAHYDSTMDAGFCDNAASVATIIGVASELVEMRDGGLTPLSSLLFIAFSGEEQGLVGSNYYYAMHANEIGKVKAIVNVDCLGSMDLTRSSTNPSQGIDLDEIVDRYADEIGVLSMSVEGSSDQQSFIYPIHVAEQIQSYWGLSPDIPENAVPFTNAIGVFSDPIIPIIPLGGSGWIHTSRDSSAYSSESGWITEQQLADQGSVVLRVSLDLIGSAESPPEEDDNGKTQMMILAGILLVATIAVGISVAVWYRRSR